MPYSLALQRKLGAPPMFDLYIHSPLTVDEVLSRPYAQQFEQPGGVEALIDARYQRLRDKVLNRFRTVTIPPPPHFQLPTGEDKP
jgi:hypothetical protein